MYCDLGPNEPVVHELLMTVSVAENRPWESFPPLSNVIDPDRLNGLFESSEAADGGTHVSFGFSESFVSIGYGDCIRVGGSGDRRSPDSETETAKSLQAAIDRKWQELEDTDTAGLEPTDG
jgi:hypothetical protein